jgi:hypothetical protein
MPMLWMAGDPASGGMIMTVSADGLMPGMATKDELAKLRAATGRDLDILYSQLMIRHHSTRVDTEHSVHTPSATPVSGS